MGTGRVVRLLGDEQVRVAPYDLAVAVPAADLVDDDAVQVGQHPVVVVVLEPAAAAYSLQKDSWTTSSGSSSPSSRASRTIRAACPKNNASNASVSSTRVPLVLTACTPVLRATGVKG